MTSHDAQTPHSTPSSPLDAEQFERWLARSGIVEESAHVSGIVSQNPDLQRATQLLKAMPPVRNAPPAPLVETNASWAALSQRIGTQQDIPRRIHIPASRRQLRPWMTQWAVAAAIVFAFIAGGYSLSLFPEWIAGPATEYHTGNAQRATVSLADGTEVTLNVASKLTVPPGFGSRQRTVQLEGEALFDVTRATGTPFIVKTSRTTTTVLGTEFTARSYSADSVTSVAVRSGKVQVDMGNQSAVLSAGRRLSLRFDGEAELSEATDGAFSFARGVLTLNNVPLKDAIPELNRWYDADVRLATPSLGAKTLLGTLPGGSRSDLAATLQLVLGVNPQVDGRVVTLLAR